MTTLHGVKCCPSDLGMFHVVNNFTEKFCKCMHSDPTTVVEHVSVYSQFFPLSYFML